MGVSRPFYRFAAIRLSISDIHFAAAVASGLSIFKHFFRYDTVLTSPARALGLLLTDYGIHRNNVRYRRLQQRQRSRCLQFVRDMRQREHDLPRRGCTTLSEGLHDFLEWDRNLVSFRVSGDHQSVRTRLERKLLLRNCEPIRRFVR